MNANVGYLKLEDEKKRDRQVYKACTSLFSWILPPHDEPATKLNVYKPLCL